MRYYASHRIICGADASRVYAIIRNSADWPTLLEPCQAVTVLAADDRCEHIEITALLNGEPMTWQSRRRFQPEVYGIEATVVAPMKLVATMSATWRIVPVNAAQSLVLLEHEYELCSGLAGQVDGVNTQAEAQRFIDSAIERNSITELGNIKAAVERGTPYVPGQEQTLRHSIVCRSSADEVYALIRSTDAWPELFDACTGVEILEATPEGELVRVHAHQNGVAVSWDTRRRYLDAIRRVDYELAVPMPLVAAMRGEWRVVELEADRCLLTVERHWRAHADPAGIRPGIETPEQAATFVHDFVDGNATAEMLAIRALIEEKTTALVSSTTRHHLPYPPDLVYALLADVGGWPSVLPHCESLDVRYDDTVDQEFTMQVRASGATETFRSVRHCDEQTLTITYFQPEPPPVLRRHRGSWQVRAIAGGAEVISRHTALVDIAACDTRFGPGAPDEHKRRVRASLEVNSGATVEACQRHLAAATSARADDDA